MAQPITWRNVEGVSMAPAGQMLRGAQDSFNDAFGSFQNTLKQREALDIANNQAQQEISKQAFLDRLGEAKTPEQLAALQASGALDSLRGSMQPLTRAALRGAEEARMGAVRQGAIQEQTYNDGQAVIAARPTMLQIAAHSEKGEWDKARALVTPGLPNAPAIMNGLQIAQRAAKTQGQQDATYEHGLKTRNLALDAARLNFDEAQLTATERKEAREVDKVVDQFATSWQASQANTRLAVEDEAAKLGINNIASMTPAQRTQLDTHLNEQGLPGVADALGGDTRGADGLRAMLRERGVSPTNMARVEGMIPSILNTGSRSPIGNDAALIAEANAKEEVGFARQDAGNSWYAPGSADARSAYDALAKEVPEHVTSTATGFAQGTDMSQVQSLLGKLATEGIKIRGSDKRVVPSPNDVMRFVRASQGEFWNPWARAKEIERQLEEWVNSPQGLKMIKAGEDSTAFRDAQRVKQLAREYLNPAPPGKK